MFPMHPYAQNGEGGLHLGVSAMLLVLPQVVNCGWARTNAQDTKHVKQEWASYEFPGKKCPI